MLKKRIRKENTTMDETQKESASSDIVHRSSSLTFIYKYLFTPVWIGGFMVGIVVAWNAPDESAHNWSRGSAIMVGYASLWLIPIMLRLRSAEARISGIELTNFIASREISYINIDWAYEIALIGPRMISLKYTDPLNKRSKRVLIMCPYEGIIFNFLKEGPMVRFIREQVAEQNPRYSSDDQPSRWIPVLFLIVTAIPVSTLLSRYF